jgi:hypothetical protein
VADGEYVALLDDDDLFTRGHLAIGSGPLECGEAVRFDKSLDMCED